MEHGPVPPHERSWRHPSELAADETAELRAIEVPRSTRAFAVATGTLGLVALGAFVLLMTPSREGASIAISATTTAAAPPSDGGSSAPTVAAVRRPVADVTTAALATPIGDGGYAVVVRTSIEGSPDDAVRVVLPSGRTVSGSIVDANSDTAVVQLAIAEPGHRIAERRPRDHDVVTVLATPPVEVAFADVDELDVAEGTAVIDAEGDLVGLCSRRGEGTAVLMVDGDAVSMDEPTARPTTAGVDHTGAETDAGTGDGNDAPSGDDPISDSGSDLDDLTDVETHDRTDVETDDRTDLDTDGDNGDRSGDEDGAESTGD